MMSGRAPPALDVLVTNPDEQDEEDPRLEQVSLEADQVGGEAARGPDADDVEDLEHVTGRLSLSARERRLVVWRSR